MSVQSQLWVEPSVASQKGRGAYFTPARIAEFLSTWAIRCASDTVLEPSCGEASFLVAAARRQSQLVNSDANGRGALCGVELHAASIPTAIANVEADGGRVDVRHGDFFELVPDTKYDVVLGNPPFIRYQSFAGSGREKGLRAALAAGVNLSGLSSSWAAFLVHASRFVSETGRLGFVLPAELLSVNYAGPLRTFLLRRFARVRLIVFEELVFPDALEDVVLLMAEGSGGCDHFEVHQLKNAEALHTQVLSGWARVEPGAKWSHALVEHDTWSRYRELCELPEVESLGAWGKAYLGAVTGNNNYFTLSDADALKLGLDERDLRRISPPGSRHLRGLDFTEAAWMALRREGKRCWLFYPRSRSRGCAADKYIEAGVRLAVDQAYKCTTRSPWFMTPLAKVPDLFLTYMDSERPRLTTNSAGVAHLNSVYGVQLHHGRKERGRDLLPVAALNTLTLLGAEVAGRAYGGGMLKLEPREAEQIPLPSLSLVSEVEPKLRALKPQLATAFRQGNLTSAVEVVDRLLLVDSGAIKPAILQQLRQAREFLYQRRMNRGRMNGRQR